jgi:hypothetical protein
MPPLDDDIKPGWKNVARRLQSACHRNNGLMLVSMTILVDAGGNPRLWTEPDTRLIEPKASSDDILRLLSALAEHKRG